MNPIVGQIVHYTNLGDKDGKYPPQVQAALITAIYRRDPKQDDGWERINEGVPLPKDIAAHMAVDLKVEYNCGSFYMQKVPYAQHGTARGHWHWPPKGEI